MCDFCKENGNYKLKSCQNVFLIGICNWNKCIILVHTLFFYTHEGIKNKAAPLADSRLSRSRSQLQYGPHPLCDALHSGAIVTIKGRCGDVHREYPEASNTALLVQMKGPHQAKSLYQCKQPLLLWDASQMLGAKMSHH